MPGHSWWRIAEGSCAARPTGAARPACPLQHHMLYLSRILYSLDSCTWLPHGVGVGVPLSVSRHQPLPAPFSVPCFPSVAANTCAWHISPLSLQSLIPCLSISPSCCTSSSSSLPYIAQRGSGPCPPPASGCVCSPLPCLSRKHAPVHTVALAPPPEMSSSTAGALPQGLCGAGPCSLPLMACAV